MGPWTTCATTTLIPETLVFPLAEPVVVAVADGLGGHPAGDVASTIVVQALAQVGGLLTDEDAVREALHGCNRAVYDQASLDPARAAMGTTVAGVVLGERSAVVFNVGDSRVYAFDGSGDDSTLSIVSVDDSPPLEPGQTHTVIVTQTLGGGARSTPINPHVSSRELDLDTSYLVCTDGLSDVVPEDEMHATLRDHQGPAAVYELWKAAISAGGPDNITLALVELVADDR